MDFTIEGVRTKLNYWFQYIEQRCGLLTCLIKYITELYQVFVTKQQFKH